jgi:hypothetical protein
MKDLPKRDLSVKDKETFMKDIKQMNINGRELVYCLIHVYNQQNECNPKIKCVPYNGDKEEEEESRGIFNFSWVYTQFPIKLRHLLSRFATIHLQKQQEEDNRTTQAF